MKIGRTVRECSDASRANPFQNDGSFRRLMISLYYPAQAVRPGLVTETYAGLFRPGDGAAQRFCEAIGVDPAHVASIDAQVHHDAALAGETPYPVVVYAPAFGIERDMYWYSIKQLVNGGCMVATVGATHESAFTVFPSGEEVGQLQSLSDLTFADGEAWEKLVRVRAADLAFVIERLRALSGTDALLRGGMDASAISLIGHSLGGAAVYRVLQRLSAADRLTVKAGILLDPSLHLLGSDPQAIDTPVLLMRQQLSSLDMLLEQGWKEELAHAFIQGQIRLAHTAEAHAFVRMEGAGHLSFCDMPLLLNESSAGSLHAVINEAMLRFLNACARGRSGGCRDTSDNADTDATGSYRTPTADSGLFDGLPGVSRISAEGHALD